MRFVIANFFLFLFLVFFATNSLAADQKYITIVNPVRGQDFFQLQGTTPRQTTEKQWQAIKDRSVNATWLIRPDALLDPEMVALLKTFPSNQEIGLFMEVTPQWTKLAGVNYRESQSWHFAGSVFLTGYEVAERQKLIDSVFEKFKENFGAYPKSVGAWWIDADSLSYMKEKYGIVANMDVSDQYTTDNYQIWGQYWSEPFYPSKRNALVPAEGDDQKIGVVTIQWATRDPFNAYGNGVLDSTYSVQANDYANPKYHNLNIDYFNNLVKIYLDNPFAKFGQVTVGLENDFSWDQYGKEYLSQLDSVVKRRQTGTAVLTMSAFAARYNSLYPSISGPLIIYAKDPLGSGGSVLWFQNAKYRIGWFYNQNGSVIRDLRVFDNSGPEPCLKLRCEVLNLAKLDVRNIDEVTYGDKWVVDEGKISDLKVTNKDSSVEISYKNSLNNVRTLKFLENDVTIDSQTKTVSGLISDIAYGTSGTNKKIEQNFNYGLLDFLPTIFSQLKNLGIFLVFALFFFYLPGLSLLKKTNLPENHKFILSWVVGICSFTLLSFVLGYFKFWWGNILLPIVSLGYLRKEFFSVRLQVHKEDLGLFLVIFLGSLSWLLTDVKNGLIFDYGMGFWGAHGHDAIWHISLIESIRNGLPLLNPAFSGTTLTNYHFFYDLLLSAASSMTAISAMDLYFRFFPIILSLGIGTVSFLLAKTWFKSKLAGILTCFFIYFGGSFGWVLSYVNNRTFGGETTFWAQQAISTLINPPFAISVLIFFAGLYLFYEFTKQINKLSLILPLIILWGSLIEFKAYVGILVLGALAIVSLVSIFKKRFGMLRLSVPILALSILVFLPNNSTSANLLVYSPFWLIHGMIDFPDRLNWLRLTYTRLAGYETNNWFKILGSEGLGLLIFILGNLGARSIGLLSVKNISIKNLNYFNIFILTFLSLSLLFPLLFIQKGANFNTIQFFYYFVVMFAFLGGNSLFILIKKFKMTGILITTLIFLVTIPTTLSGLQNYLPSRPPARISNAEIEALNFLKGQKKGVVISPAFDKYLKDRFYEPLPIFTYVSTPYISALSGQAEYLSDTVNLDILDVDYKGRLQAQKDIFNFKEPEVVKGLLSSGNINYLYIPKVYNIEPNEQQFGIKKIFDNAEVRIYEKI